MKEATGSTLLIQIMLIFIAIYIAFLAVSINYSSAFRVKNKLITIVEIYEGWAPGSVADDEIAKFLGEIGYTNEYQIEGVSTDRGPYYRVTAYISFEFPVVGTFFNIPITGETKVIYNKE